MTAPNNPFAHRLLAWYEDSGRHDLPWHHPVDPYRVWVSEIMLQQTRVGTVIPYFQRFLARFPDPVALADAPLDDVLAEWAGLGYYARARNLHAAAGQVRDQHGGTLPADFDSLVQLPGIGRSTAGAILAQAFNQPYAILDGNVRRVLARYHAVPGWPGRAAVAKRLWQLAEEHTPERSVAAYTQAIMDLGATVCVRTRPQCGHCPLQWECRAHADSTQHRYPEPKPRRERRLVRTCMLLLEDDSGRILLERRPPTGVWGSLWSLPELPPEEGVASYCRERLGLEVSHQEQWHPLRHGFTHFELEITPIRVRVAGGSARIMDDGAVIWYKTGAGHKAGVPAPVHRLLNKATAGREAGAG